MNVRRYNGEALETLLQASEAEGFGFVSRLITELAAGTYGQPGCLLLGAYEGAALLAVCGLTPDPYLGVQTSGATTSGVTTPPVGRVRHLYVLPEHRREGLGRALVEAIVSAARPHYTRLRLRTKTARASAFYLSLGFVETAEPGATHALALEP